MREINNEEHPIIKIRKRYFKNVNVMKDKERLKNYID